VEFMEKKLMIILPLTVGVTIVHVDLSKKKILGLKLRQRRSLLFFHKIANCLAA